MFGRRNEQPKGLKIIIVGCGKVGSTLVEQLVLEGHDITVIDTNITKIEELTNLYDIMGLEGNGAYNLVVGTNVHSNDPNTISMFFT